MERSDWKTFREETLKVRGPRKHNRKNSWGVQDAYKHCMKNKLFKLEESVPIDVFRKIIRTVNLMLIDSFLEGQEIKFPCGMGFIIPFRRENKIQMKDGKVIDRYPINWDATLKLWFEDEDSRENKVTVKKINKERFFVKHVFPSKGKMKNKTALSFFVNRQFRDRVREKVKEGNFFAYNTTYE